MKPTTSLTLLLVCIQSPLTTAWTHARASKRLEAFRLRGSRSDDLNFNRYQLESVFNGQEVGNKDVVHIGGLFESLSSLPVYDWTDSEFDWIDLASPCRDDECEVSRPAPAVKKWDLS